MLERTSLVKAVSGILKIPCVELYITESGLSLENKIAGKPSNLVITHLINGDTIVTTNNCFLGKSEASTVNDMLMMIKTCAGRSIDYARNLSCIDMALQLRDDARLLLRTDVGYMHLELKFNHSKYFDIY